MKKILSVLLFVSFPTLGYAQSAFQHVVREGENLAAVADRYYGDARKEVALVAENSLALNGGSTIVPGMRLHIPFVDFHRVVAGDTWESLSVRYYGDGEKAFIIADANRTALTSEPAEGIELLIPYPLRHVVTARNETIAAIARTYYGNQTEQLRRLRRFNGPRANRVERGQIILVPMVSLTLSEQGRAAVAARTGQSPSSGNIRDTQSMVEDQLPGLYEELARGRFIEVIEKCNQLIGTSALSGNQTVTVERLLATAYVAVGRDDLAETAFRTALQHQPDLTLDSARTSPRVIRVFEAARVAR